MKSPLIATFLLTCCALPFPGEDDLAHATRVVDALGATLGIEKKILESAVGVDYARRLDTCVAKMAEAHLTCEEKIQADAFCAGHPSAYLFCKQKSRQESEDTFSPWEQGLNKAVVLQNQAADHVRRARDCRLRQTACEAESLREIQPLVDRAMRELSSLRERP